MPVPTMNGIVSALRFFFTHTLDRPDLARRLVRVAHSRKMPVVLSPDEVARLNACAASDPWPVVGAISRPRHKAEPDEPDICNLCEVTFARRMKARRFAINATVLFADLRATRACRSLGRATRFQACSTPSTTIAQKSIWEQDGLLNKTMGDAVMAIFNFPIPHDDHPRRGVLAARKI